MNTMAPQSGSDLSDLPTRVNSDCAEAPDCTVAYWLFCREKEGRVLLPNQIKAYVFSGRFRLIFGRSDFGTILTL